MQIRKRRSVALSFFCSMSAIVFLDQFTKHLVKTHLLFFHSVPLIRGWLDLVYVHNTGFAFGFFDGPGNLGKTLFFTGITLASVVVIIYFLFNAIQKGDGLEGIFLGMIGGGAVGNLLDRFLVGAVVDFIDVHYKRYHWPAFNVADSAISVGVILLLLHFMFQKRQQKAELMEGNRDASRSVSHR